MRQQFGSFVSTSNEAVADDLEFDYRQADGPAFGVSFYLPSEASFNNN